jgi:hypothetical protein
VRNTKREAYMAIEFYNVKTRSKVSVDESQVKKVVLKTASGDRFALRAQHEGTNLTKFISKATYDTLNVSQG